MNNNKFNWKKPKRGANIFHTAVASRSISGDQAMAVGSKISDPK